MTDPMQPPNRRVLTGRTNQAQVSGYQLFLSRPLPFGVILVLAAVVLDGIGRWLAIGALGLLIVARVALFVRRRRRSAPMRSRW